MTDKEPIDKMIELSEDLGLYEEQIKDSLKKQDKNFSENPTQENKSIIIDGVDVNGCEFLIKTLHCKAQMSIMGTDTNKCKCFPNCYFKQLQRKEQEYEELRQYHNKCCKEFENEKQALLVKYNQISNNFYNGDYCNTEHCSLLKAKEQKYELLVRTNKTHIDMLDQLNNKYIDLEQECDCYRDALEEIRKIIKS